MLYGDKKIIVGRDKPDAAKGVLQKVTSTALTDSPKLEWQVSELVAHINGKCRSLHFIPVHHYHQSLKKDEFCALLEAAELGAITPLRDGMNTCRWSFQHMSEALQANPWDLGMLLSQMSGQTTAKRTPYIPKDRLKESYDRAKKRLFLFDYDGTLTPIVKTPSMALPSPDALLALTKLASDPANIVYIVSGRDQAFLETHLGHIRHLGMSAEHDGFIREPQNGEREWVNFTEKLDMNWMEEVAEVFWYYTERTTGSHIEVKKSSITWHYPSSDPEWGCVVPVQCQDLLENNLVPKRPIEVLVGKKNLEVRPIAVNKGEIVKRILYLNPDAEFIFCAGDDKTDEDMFRALLLFPTSLSGKATMEAPLSVTLASGKGSESEEPPVELAILPEDIYHSRRAQLEADARGLARDDAGGGHRSHALRRRRKESGRWNARKYGERELREQEFSLTLKCASAWFFTIRTLFGSALPPFAFLAVH
ncbi:hypothetical protein ID866_9685 [Astraeus odoratus]|nr:hypothetical protein ID866_9685 [Astraeus odoratus]